MARTILVSNRLPITAKRVADRLQITRSAGGLVAGLGPVHDRHDSLWIGTLGAKSEIEAGALREQRLVHVPLRADDARRHYEGFSNGVLWPLFHYLLNHVAFDTRDFDAYCRVNERFAAVIAEHAEPGDHIWVHDYHLMLLPRMLRERLPDVRIGFFLHIPFPSSEVFRLLPRKEEILRGLLGANLIGLHTYDYARHLVSSFRRILGVEFDDQWVHSADRDSRIGVFPLGVDVASLETLASRSPVEKRLERLRTQVQGRKVILGVDRLDYTKGLPHRLDAYRRLLQIQPYWRTHALFIQLAVPSRSGIGSYQELKQDIDRRVGAIDGEFAREALSPIQYMYRSVSPEELAALYRLADVALVTPVRDGMNLVAKEYVATRLADDGVLVLSEFAGAAAEMGEALFVNPWDIDATAHALDRALRMSTAEASQRMRALRRRVRKNDVHRWVTRFLDALNPAVTKVRIGEKGRALHATAEQASWIEELLARFRASETALVALDYDGTLTELVPEPSAAAPSDELRALLRELATQRGVEVVIVSGRDPTTLERWLGEIPVSLVAEHGFHWRLRRQDEWEELIPSLDLSWKESVRGVMDEYAARCSGAIVEEKLASIVWHHRKVEPGFGEWQAHELLQHLRETFAQSPIEVLQGAKIVEVRAQGFDKGRAYKLLDKELGPFDFILAAGDDRTDEDLFAALPPDAWSIKVGQGVTQARFRIDTPDMLRAFLAQLIATRG